MISDAQLSQMRSVADRVLVDTGTITRPASGGTIDGDGVWAPSAAATVYSGAMRVGAPQRAFEGTTGDAETVSASYTVTVPAAATTVETGDRVDVTTTSDPAMAGISLRVVSVDMNSLHVSRRLRCELLITE